MCVAKSCLKTTDVLQAQIDTLTQTVERQGGALKTAHLTIDKLNLELAYLRRMHYGRSSEQMDAQQLELLAQSDQNNAAPVIDLQAERERRKSKSNKRPELRHLPGHLPRETVIHEPGHGADCTCLGCGSELRAIGQDISDVLDYEPGSFKVIRHVRPRYAWGQCNSICQASAAERPIERGMAGAGLLTHVLTGKYCDHLPLYRQSQIYKRVGVDLHRSTLADWLGQTSALLRPLGGKPDASRPGWREGPSGRYPRYRCLTRAAGAARSPDCGLTYAMIGQPLVPRHRRYGSITRRIARANTQQDISGRSMASCRLMAMRALTRCMNRRAKPG
jgi:transposase